MPGIPFEIVDVFAERKYAGNQLAVFRDAGALSAGQMQALARETNFSETTFVVDERAPRVRIFTPRAEIPFAGHPTIGTAAVLMGEAREITLQLEVGPIHVWRDGDLYWMRQPPPKFGARFDAADVAAMLGLDAQDVASPCEEVSTGLPHLIVPLASLDALRRVRLDLARYDAHVAKADAKCLFPFAMGATDGVSDVTVRQFAPFYDINEDPATGSGSGALVAYLSRHRILGGETVDARVSQGEWIGRPSRLYVRARPGDDGTLIDVGGKVQRVAEGRLVG